MIRVTDYQVLDNGSHKRIIVTKRGVTWSNSFKKNHPERNIHITKASMDGVLIIRDEDKNETLHFVSMPFVIEIEDGFEVGQNAKK